MFQKTLHMPDGNPVHFHGGTVEVVNQRVYEWLADERPAGIFFTYTDEREGLQRAILKPADDDWWKIKNAPVGGPSLLHTYELACAYFVRDMPVTQVADDNGAKRAWERVRDDLGFCLAAAVRIAREEGFSPTDLKNATEHLWDNPEEGADWENNVSPF